MSLLRVTYEFTDSDLYQQFLDALATDPNIVTDSHDDTTLTVHFVVPI